MNDLMKGRKNWSAFGIINGFITVFNNNWCKSTSALVHEIGHNLGLHHSNENGGEYEDLSGMMGHSFLHDDRPVMCFNTAKHWQLGWFEDRQATLKPLMDEFWNGSLIGYADYKNSAAPSDSIVALKIEGHNLNYYVGFNHVAGVNRENQETDAANKVTVHSVGTATAESSNIEAKLGIGGVFEIPRFGGKEHSVLLEVEYIDMEANPPVAKINVQLLKCSSDADCDDDSPCTTDTCDISSGFCHHKSSGLCSFVNVVVLTDRYPKETSWEIRDNCNGDEVVMSSGAGYYSKSFGENLHSENVLSKSKYTFEIKDAWGDGICCGASGNGSYHVHFNEDLVAEGGDFKKSEMTTWGSCETAAPTVSPTSCEIPYELTFRSGYSATSASWSFAHGHGPNISKIIRQSSEAYQRGSVHTEEGCLPDDCYEFVIEDAYSYSLSVNGHEIVNKPNLKRTTEITLFGTCALSASRR